MRSLVIIILLVINMFFSTIIRRQSVCGRRPSSTLGRSQRWPIIQQHRSLCQVVRRRPRWRGSQSVALIVLKIVRVVV